MQQKQFNNVRFKLKGDTLENLKKASGFIPLNKELVAITPDENTKFTKLMVGDGVTPVSDLEVINPQADWLQNDPSKADFIKNKPFGADNKTLTLGNTTLTEEDLIKILNFIQNIEC